MVMFNAVIITVLWTLCASQSRQIQQDCFKMVKLGESVKIKCLTKSIWRIKVWYKLGSNRSLLLLASTTDVHETKNESRYSMQSSPTETTLTIPHMTVEDVGVYYCGILNLFNIHFGSGTVLELEGESRPVQPVQSPDDIRVQRGDSVTLSCAFNTSHSNPEHISVTWVKSSASEIITWNNINETFCDTNMNTEEMLCVHNMTLSDVGSAADGTYLCVVTACGNTQIGTGTRIHVYVPDLDPTVLVLTVLNVVFGAAVVVLVWVVYSNRKNQHTDVYSCPGSTDREQAEDEITYAGVNLVPWSAPCRSASVIPREDPVVYSEVRN